MATEYRALRASALRLWAQSQPSSAQVEEITRFNEAIDQALVESVTRFAERTKQSTDLFIGVLGHDIRNPLFTISMSLHVLTRSGRLDEETAQPLLHSVARIKSIIGQILDFTRGQAGRSMPITRTPGDLAHYAEEIAEETRIQHPEATIIVQRDGSHFQGDWDAGRIDQLLSNLLVNAIDHGDPTQPVTMRLWASEREVMVEIRNFGRVIPASECARIFEPLVRGSFEPDRGERTGLGLGLYICREIVRAHGGRIEVHSDATEGTRFIAQLPRRAGA